MATEAPLSPNSLREDLLDAGVDVIAETDDAAGLARAAVRHRPHFVVQHSPHFVVAASISPSAVLIEAARLLHTLAPCPFIMFTSDGDAQKIESASHAGIHAYGVDGHAKHRLLSIIQVARARFRHEPLLKGELSGLSQRFEARKWVGRATGGLMRSRGVTEDEAFELLRSLAMRTRQRLGVVAQSVIEMSRAGEAINRSGQLRMRSQRNATHRQAGLSAGAVAQRRAADAVARAGGGVCAGHGLSGRCAAVVGGHPRPLAGGAGRVGPPERAAGRSGPVRSPGRGGRCQ